MNQHRIPMNPQRSPAVHVGTLTVHEPVTVDLQYETAAWRSTIALTPGEYPVYAFEQYGRRGLVADIAGTYVVHDTPSLYSDVRIGADAGADMVGTPATYRACCGFYAQSEEHAGRLFSALGSFAPLPGADLRVGMLDRGGFSRLVARAAAYDSRAQVVP